MATSTMKKESNGLNFSATFAPSAGSGFGDIVAAEKASLPQYQNIALDAISDFQEEVAKNPRLTQQLKDFISIKCEYIRPGIVSPSKSINPVEPLVDAVRELQVLCQKWDGVKGIEGALMKVVDGMLSYKIDEEFNLISRFPKVSVDDMKDVKKIILENIGEIKQGMLDFCKTHDSNADVVTCLLINKKMGTLKDILIQESVDIIDKQYGDTKRRAYSAIGSIKTVLFALGGESAYSALEKLSTVKKFLKE